MRRPHCPFAAFLAASALLLAAANPATGQISGTVTDGQTGESVIGANVVLKNFRDPDIWTGQATGIGGEFGFPGARGRFILEVTHINFRPHTDTLWAPAEITIALQEAANSFNQVTITASRRAERKLDAPARVTVIEPTTPSTLTVADHLQEAPSVDLIRTGLNQSRVVVRGFNDNLSSSLLTLVDGRIARAPAVRLTALQLLPTAQDDIARIEVVSGPASALYGPNAANGVVHVVTTSAFDAPGTRFSLTGGQQSVLAGSVRHAAALNSRWAYKVTAQYYGGEDFEYVSPAEQDARRAAIAAGNDPGRIGQRDLNVSNTAVTGRVEGRLPGGTNLRIDSGFTQGDNIETTPTGAAQVVGARLSYGQIQLSRDKSFLQAYGNFLNSGDSFFLRTGESFVDKSRLFVLQGQQRRDPGDGLRDGLEAALGRRIGGAMGRTGLTYGFDWYRTVPRNEGTVSGGYEDDDTMNEPGLYVQTDTELSARWALTLAGRLDYHDRLEDLYFSPRGAIVFKPDPTTSVRVTYNRALKTPASNQIFGDVLGLRDAFGLSGLGSLFGVSGRTDIRAQGMITGFTFERGQNGFPRWHSPFAADPSQAFDLHDPAMTAVMWDIARFASVAGLAENLASSGFIEAGDVAAVSAALETVLPATVDGVLHQLQVLDLDNQQFFAVPDVEDQPALGITRTETAEVGFQGLIGRGTVVGIDAYWSRVRDFVGPLFVGTPNVFLDAGTLNAALLNDLPAALAANPDAAAALIALDEAAFVGNRNGSAAEEIAGLVSTGVAGAIPFGTVTPRESFDPTAVVLMRRNFGDISLFGADISVTQFLSAGTQVGASFAWVSDDEFRSDGQTVALNAPRWKYTAFGRAARGPWTAQARVRGSAGFPVRSDVYVGETEAYTVVDLSIAREIRRDTRLSLTVQNLADRRHRQFVDVAEIGRLAMLRLEVGL
ncbi:MAG: TonB-dependent receptor [Rhodothermales bacterium]|nr:TonB-dependent receptor [Rhodothermales bacterium]MBO6780988.1 TonB-dependent receptor [Rhodothermales bacterium]